MYNPSVYIYGDVSELAWVPGIDSTYNLTGGELYQATIQENGNYTNKYLGGVAIMQTPFFLIGHAVAKMSDYPADGFSAPYQYSIAFAGIFYCLLGLFILRNVMLRFFRDGPVAITLLLLGLGTNLIQYAAIDGAQSHIYIFPLYSLVLWATIKWHHSPHWKWAALIGFVIGLATICRPTELIMLFIPLLWNTHEKEVRKEKWKLVRKHLPHLWVVIGFGILGILPQLIYWKITTGGFVHNVGSKWFFFNPWFRVLFGAQNGFFIYTPITILFIVGFFFTKKYSFHRSVLTFCLLNIWIIIAWADWRYGATFSTRALVQSYPVFALSMCAAITWVIDRKILRLLVFNLGAFFIYANIFQIIQYNNGVLHYHDMNWKYYSHVYLNPSPTPLDFSLLDNDIYIDENDFNKVEIKESNVGGFGKSELGPVSLSNVLLQQRTEYVKVEAEITSDVGMGENFLKLQMGEKVLAEVRLKRPLAQVGEKTSYAFYAKIPKKRSGNMVSVTINGWNEVYSGTLHSLKVTQYYRK